MDLTSHWDTVYQTRDPKGVSWYQPRPELALELLASVGTAADALVDVGAGASTLVDHLLDGGYRDLTLVDISAAALAVTKARLGPVAGVRYTVADVRDWHPSRQFDLWHDRAVFHFLTEAPDRAAYRRALMQGLRPGGHAVVSTFHLAGPDRCSDLPTARYDAAGLVDALGGVGHFDLVEDRIEEHAHPRGGTQRFVVVVVRRRP